MIEVLYSISFRLLLDGVDFSFGINDRIEVDVFGNLILYTIADNRIEFNLQSLKEVEHLDEELLYNCVSGSLSAGHYAPSFIIYNLERKRRNVNQETC